MSEGECVRFACGVKALPLELFLSSSFRRECKAHVAVLKRANEVPNSKIRVHEEWDDLPGHPADHMYYVRGKNAEDVGSAMRVVSLEGLGDLMRGGALPCEK